MACRKRCHRRAMSDQLRDILDISLRPVRGRTSTVSESDQVCVPGRPGSDVPRGSALLLPPLPPRSASASRLTRDSVRRPLLTPQSGGLVRRRSRSSCAADRPAKRHSDSGDPAERRRSDTDGADKENILLHRVDLDHNGAACREQLSVGRRHDSGASGNRSRPSSSSSEDSFHTAPQSSPPIGGPQLRGDSAVHRQQRIRRRTSSDAPVYLDSRPRLSGIEAVSVRQRVGQIEQQLCSHQQQPRVLLTRPERSRSPSHTDESPATTVWYSNQDEEGHVYFFGEGSSESYWALPPAENGASQHAQHKELPVRLGGAPPLPPQPGQICQVRDGRIRSMVAPAAPDGKPGWTSHLRTADRRLNVLHQGTLNRTRLVTETGRRLRKNWAPCHVVLTDCFLLLFKDAKGGLLGSAGHRPEITIDLAGAVISWEPEKSSKRNVFQVSTVHGQRLLLQDENSTTAGVWYDAIRRAIGRLPLGVDRLIAPPESDPLRLTRTHSVRLHQQQGQPGQPGLSSSQEELSRTDSTTIRDRLRRFFRARPPADSLIRRGILKDEPVFGCHLESLAAAEGCTVPRFVRDCIQAIEARPEHMKMDGVYRASGNLSQVQRIRCEVDQDNYQVLFDEEDVHVLTGALKLFFRELKEPLVPFRLLPAALSAAGLTGRVEQVTAFRQLTSDLPLPNRDTLRTLLCHLNRVAELQEYNRMHAHNLAIVFGPTLMWPETESPDLALDLIRQNRVVEALLENFSQVFDDV